LRISRNGDKAEHYRTFLRAKAPDTETGAAMFPAKLSVNTVFREKNEWIARLAAAQQALRSLGPILPVTPSVTTRKIQGSSAFYVVIFAYCDRRLKTIKFSLLISRARRIWIYVERRRRTHVHARAGLSKFKEFNLTFAGPIYFRCRATFASG
jgi:hypothetical protein